MSVPVLRRLAATFAALAIVSLFGLVAFAQDGGQDVDASWAAVLWDSYDAAPYTDWAYQPGAPEGFYVGQQPHGMVLRTYANDIAVEDVASGAATFSSGAVIVKENHMPTGVDTESMEHQDPVSDFGGDLAAWTYMVKVPGYAPDSGDWFWGRIAPDGSVMAGGTPDGCVGCHSQVEDNDWVFNSQMGGN
jgi:hypothetical protein